MNLLTTTEAGKVLGVSAIRVRQLIRSGTIPARYVHSSGRDYLIDAKGLKGVKVQGNDGKRGRPRKAD